MIQRETIRILNELVKFHYDRIEGYRVASSFITAGDDRVQNIFTSMSDESKRCIYELSEQICLYGGSVMSQTTLMGKIYRYWMRLKLTAKPANRLNALLESCCFGEYAIQKAYETAQERSDELTEDAASLINTQEIMLRRSYWTLKDYSHDCLLPV